MGRPRAYDRESLLDHALRLWVAEGSAGLTIRGLSERSGASTGAIYHAFGSRDVILARVWAREAERFLAHQRDAVESALAQGGPVDAVVAAALAPADHLRRDEPAGRLLLSVTAADLAGGDVGPAERARLRALRGAVDHLVAELAEAVWGVVDRGTRRLMAACLVDLPSALLLPRERTDDRFSDHLARHALEHAVRGVLDAPLPE